MKREKEIVENESVAPGVFKLTLYAPDIAAAIAPGQFINVYINDGAMLLPRPFSVSDADGGRLTLVCAVVGRG
ncbi:MAG: dihydroorotate dehydrogenase electron transfer subunit, partial [Clostridiales Family XIII bacterium]|nr:dihydroorotate dehydrogenase electron transfer subunit [Clostridiales Family XIII bacterium]